MQKNGDIVSASAEEIDELLANGGDLTDPPRVKAMAPEIERLAEEEDSLMEEWTLVPDDRLPGGLQSTRVQVDRDLLTWFQADGPDYSGRINDVLRAYVGAQRQSAPQEPAPAQ